MAMPDPPEEAKQTVMLDTGAETVAVPVWRLMTQGTLVTGGSWSVPRTVAMEERRLLKKSQHLTQAHAVLKLVALPKTLEAAQAAFHKLLADVRKHWSRLYSQTPEVLVYVATHCQGWQAHLTQAQLSLVKGPRRRFLDRGRTRKYYRKRRQGSQTMPIELAEEEEEDEGCPEWQARTPGCSLTMHTRSLNSLLPKQWLDENAVLAAIMAALQQHPQAVTVVHPQLHSEWRGRPDTPPHLVVPTTTKTFVPVHTTPDHWYLATIDGDRRVQVYDSLAPARVASDLAPYLTWLFSELTDIQPTLALSARLQQNCVDCGVWVAAITKALVEGRKPETATVDGLRQQTLRWCFQGQTLETLPRECLVTVLRRGSSPTRGRKRGRDPEPNTKHKAARHKEETTPATAKSDAASVANSGPCL